MAPPEHRRSGPVNETGVSTRRRGIGLLLVAAAGASVLCLAHGTSLAQEEEEDALAAYQKAVAYAQDGSWDEALDHFQKAADLGAPVVVHYNIGRCLEALDRFEEAAASYTRYLEDPSATDVDEVKEKIGELREKPSHVTIRSAPSGAAVLKRTDGGDSVVGTAPYEADLEAGTHVFILRLSGFEDKIVEVTSGYGKTIVIESALEKPAAPAETGQAESGGSQAGGTPRALGRGALGLVVEAGGGVSLHMYRQVDTTAGGSFLIDIHKILGHGRLHFAAGAQVSGNTYTLAAVGGGKYSAMFTDALAFVHLRFGLTNRLVLVASLPLGFSFLSALEPIPEEAELGLLGGRLAGGSLPFFSAGFGAALRVNIVRGLHVLLRPVEVMLLFPLKKLYSDNKVLPRYSLTVFLGWEF